MFSKETILYSLGKRDRFAPFALNYMLLNKEITVDPLKKISCILKAVKLLNISKFMYASVLRFRAT